jgi:hypothetical protein
MLLLQQIATFLFPDVDAPLSLNWKMDLLTLVSHKATRPFSLAEARIWGTSLFHETEVTYEP